MFCDYIVCIEIGGADDDERKELINSLSGSHDVHLDGNPQGRFYPLDPQDSSSQTITMMNSIHLYLLFHFCHLPYKVM